MVAGLECHAMWKYAYSSGTIDFVFWHSGRIAQHAERGWINERGADVFGVVAGLELHAGAWS